MEHIESGAIFRVHISEGTALGMKAKGFIDRGELVPDGQGQAGRGLPGHSSAHELFVLCHWSCKFCGLQSSANPGQFVFSWLPFFPGTDKMG